MNVTNTTNVSRNFKTKTNFTSTTKNQEIYSGIDSTSNQTKKTLIGVSAAAALVAVVAGGIMFTKGKGYKIVEGLDDFGNKTLEKLTKKGQMVERKIFREDGETLSRIEHYTDGIRRKAVYFKEDGKTTSFIADYVGNKIK